MHISHIEITPIDDLMSPIKQNITWIYLFSVSVFLFFVSSTIPSEFADSGELFL